MHQRKLNEIEYLNWTLGQPYNISLCITVTGDLKNYLLRNALDKVQKKHPMLQAQLFVDDEVRPHLIWGEIGKIPLKVQPRKNDEQYKEIVENEFVTPFETGKHCSIPLIRVISLYSQNESNLIITMQHVIADGMSMVYLFKDILDFMITPELESEPIDIVKKITEILPSHYQKKIPKNPRKFYLLFGLSKIVVGFYRFGSKFKRRRKRKKIEDLNAFENKKFLTREWVLSKERSQLLIKKCKEYNVSVHSAICTFFLLDFPVINTPVNLRDRLLHPVGHSVGLYAGGLVLNHKYKEKIPLWKNVELYNKKLTKNLSGDKVFSIFKIISPAVPLRQIEKFGPIYLELASKNNPLGITNLGSLDELNMSLKTKDFQVTNLFGGVSFTLDVLIVATFTIKGEIHFYFQYYNPPHTKDEIEKYVLKFMKQLEIALEN